MTLDINATSNYAPMVSGELVHPITNEERTLFGIQDADLKYKISTNNGYAYLQGGKQPDQAWVTPPAEHDGIELYSNYHWTPVSTHWTVVSATVEELDQTPQIVKSVPFINNSSETGSFNTGISQSVRNTISTTWAVSAGLSIGAQQKIQYAPGGSGGETSGSIEFDLRVGYSDKAEKSTTLGSTSGVRVNLAPGERVWAVLVATRGVLKLRVEYDVYLRGQVACRFAEKFNDHWFWGYDIARNVLANNQQNPIRQVQTIEIGFFSGGEIRLEDSEPSSYAASTGARGAYPAGLISGPNPPVVDGHFV